MPASIGKAVAIQGFLQSMASLFAIGVIFSSTKHLDQRYASLIIAPILYSLSCVAVTGLKEVKKSEKVLDSESPNEINLRKSSFSSAFKLQLRLLKEFARRDNSYNICFVGLMVSEMGYLLSFVYINAWVSQFFIGKPEGIMMAKSLAE